MQDDRRAGGRLSARCARRRGGLENAPRLLPCVLAGALLGALLACKHEAPKAGDFCKLEEQGSLVCGDATTALLCDDHHRKPVPCRGPAGCHSGECDNTVAREGDACLASLPPPATFRPDQACADDRTRTLVCRDGTFVPDRLCRGAAGCDAAKIARGAMDACDRSRAQPGDPCQADLFGGLAEKIGVCSTDGKAALVCSTDYGKGSFVLGRACTGPKGCAPAHPSWSAEMLVASCDGSVETEGAPCGRDDMNLVSCTPDGRLVVVCDADAHTWKKLKDCGPTARCFYEERKALVDGLSCR